MNLMLSVFCDCIHFFKVEKLFLPLAESVDQSETVSPTAWQLWFQWIKGTPVSSSCLLHFQAGFILFMVQCPHKANWSLSITIILMEKKSNRRLWCSSLRFLLSIGELYSRMWSHVWCIALNYQPLLMSCFYTECFVYMPPCILENTVTGQSSLSRRNGQACGLRPTQPKSLLRTSLETALCKSHFYCSPQNSYLNFYKSSGQHLPKETLFCFAFQKNQQWALYMQQ